MSTLKIVVIGANTANIQEIENVVVATVGMNANIIGADINNYKNFTKADLYVCLINRQQEVESFFGASKVVALTLVPPTDYFLEISKLPAQQNVIVFNNTFKGTAILMGLLSKYHLTHVHYEVVPYDEWSQEQVIEKLVLANYITGSIGYVAAGRDLYTKFGKYLLPDVTVLVSPPRIATAESVSYLARVAGLLYHKAMMKKLQKSASMDYLTEIANRRTFDERLLVECNHARRARVPILLAMLDVDFFKSYNDHYGHIAGDECLKKISKQMQCVLNRSTDFCARYGGEEFTIILHDTSLVNGKHVLEAIRQAIERLAINHEFSNAAAVVTVSIGFTVEAITIDSNIAAENLLARADQALYQAKRQGRNRVSAFEEVSSSYVHESLT